MKCPECKSKDVYSWKVVRRGRWTGRKKARCRQYGHTWRAK